MNPKFEKNISLKNLPNPGLNGQISILSFVDQNYIFFLYGDPLKPMVKFDTNQDNHRKIPKSHIPLSQVVNMNGVRISNKFWVMGGSITSEAIDTIDLIGTHSSNFQSNRNPLTSFWSLGKEVWFNGPNIPKDPEPFGGIIPEMLFACLVTSNRSTVYLSSTFHHNLFTVSYNIFENTWTSHESIPLYFDAFQITDCALHTTKNLKRFIINIFVDAWWYLEYKLGIYDVDMDTWSDPMEITASGRGNFEKLTI